MATTDNLQDFLTSIADSIRTKKGTTEQINAQNFDTEIESLISQSEISAALRADY